MLPTNWASAVSTRFAGLAPRALALGLPRPLGPDASAPDTFVLMAPSVEGSRGDAAMMEVLLRDLRRKFDGRVVLLCYKRGERHADLVQKYGVEVACLEHLARHPLQLRKLLHRTHTFRLIGADIVDGFYSPLTTGLRLSTAQAFAHAGCDAKVISFSFCATPMPSIARLWQQLPPSLGLLTRDPESKRRLSALLGREVAQAADLAFLLEPDPEGINEQLRWIGAQRDGGQMVVGVGVNALLLNAGGQRALAQVVTRLLHQRPKLSLLFVAHDFRAKSSDLDTAWGTMSYIAPEVLERTAVVAQEYGPRQLKAIAQRLDAVVSGRMHFSIAALSQAVPAFCFRYQGKVEGLLELTGFGTEIEQLSIDSASLEPQWVVVADRINAFLDRRPELAQRISGKLEHLKQLSALNLEHPRLPSKASSAAEPKNLGARAVI